MCVENCQDGERCSCLQCPCEGCTCAGLDGYVLVDQHVGGLCARHGLWEGTLDCPECPPATDPSKVIASQSISDNLIKFTMADGSTIEISIANGWRDARLVMEARA